MCSSLGLPSLIRKINDVHRKVGVPHSETRSWADCVEQHCEHEVSDLQPKQYQETLNRMDIRAPVLIYMGKI